MSGFFGGGGGGGGGYATVQDEGVPVAASATMNFVGGGVAASDVGGVTTVTIGAGSVAVSSADIAFTDGDTMRRVTITDAGVGATSKIVGTIRRADTADDSADRGYVYTCNVVKVAAGSFDVLVACLDPYLDPTQMPPNETVKFYYVVG